MSQLRMIVAKGTKIPYINAKNQIMFYSEDYDKPCTIAHAEIFELKEYSDSELANIATKYGVKEMRIISASKTETLPLPNQTSHRYSNQETNNIIAKYKFARDKNTLRKLGLCKFLVPVRFKDMKKTYPYLEYMVIKKKDNAHEFLVIFSDYEEFQKYQKEHQGYWKLIELTPRQISHVSKKREIYINPYGNRLVIEGEKKKDFFNPR